MADLVDLIEILREQLRVAADELERLAKQNAKLRAKIKSLQQKGRRARGERK